MKVSMLDLGASYQAIREELDAAIRTVMEHQHFIMGPEVEQLETTLAKFLGVKHVISCANGSDALLLALMALGIGPGDEVITTPYSFIATVSCITRLGARPVFVDIDPETFNLDAGRIEAAVTPRTKAIIPVHLFGQCADMEAIGAVAERHSIPIVEDAAQAIGARWAGKAAGAMGQIASFSFYPSKNLGAFGDGGALSVNDDALAAKLRALRTHGGQKKYFYDYVGMNSRLDTLQAAILNVRFRHLHKYTANRQHYACRYYALFGEYKLVDTITLPIQRLKASHVYNQFVIRAPRRDALRAFLKERDIGTEIYYPHPLHLQPCFAYLGYGPGDFPEAEKASAESLAIPVHPDLTDDHLRAVASAIADFYRG